MGSLDAWLVAFAFRCLGDSVWVIRAVQIILYLLYLVTLWLMGRRFFKDRSVACWAVCCGAIPPVLLSTYTTASLGGYGETILLGNLILLGGYEVVFGRWQKVWWGWLALGLVSGLAFWTLGLAGVYILTVAVIGVWRFSWRNIPFYLTCLVGFLIGSSPWWVENLVHGGEALAVLTGTSHLSLVSSTPLERLVGFVFLGLPALLGIRAPWSGQFIAWPLLLLMIVFYGAMLLYWIKNTRQIRSEASPGALRLLAGMVVMFSLVFVGTHFGLDATGRYFLPMYVPLFLGLAVFMAAASRRRVIFGLALLSVWIFVQGLETARAVAGAEGLTTQFDPITCFDNRFDDDLIRFLNEKQEKTGYTNYWVSFRLAYLSNEQLIYTAQLPYKPDMRYTTADNRYPYYQQVVDQSPAAAYITTKHPTLDQYIRDHLDRLGVTYQEEQIGVYHIFYSLSRKVIPQELGLGKGT
jgi:4-amino-4-deoxy-L-arabinose transferase-like glycosyltransferase